MATYQSLLPQILPEVPGCPQTIVLQKLADTVRHFCRESWFWQEPIEPVTLIPFIPLAPDSHQYELATDGNTEVLGVIYLLHKGRTLPSASVNAMDHCMPGWREQSAPDPRAWLPVGSNRVMFNPHADTQQARAVTGRVAVAPAVGALVFGDPLLTYTDGLVAGTLARLQRMAKSEWAEPQMSATNQAIYAESLSLARLEAMREHHADAPVAHPLLDI